MRAELLLALYAERHPGRVTFLQEKFDYGFSEARAVYLVGPSGRRYRRAVRWKVRAPLPEGDIMRHLALPHRRRLKRWLR